MSHLELPKSAAAPADMFVGKSATADPVLPETAFVLESFSEAEAPVFETPLPDSRPTPQPEARGQLVSLSTLKEVKDYPKPIVRPVEIIDECLVPEICIDEYFGPCTNERPRSTRTR